MRKKKNLIKLYLPDVMALVLSFAMLTRCGRTSEKDYRNDMEAFAEMSDDMEDISDDPEEMNSVIKGLKVSTPEGKAVKEDMQAFHDAAVKAGVDEAEFGDIDFDFFTDLTKPLQSDDMSIGGAFHK